MEKSKKELQSVRINIYIIFPLLVTLHRPHLSSNSSTFLCLLPCSVCMCVCVCARHQLHAAPAATIRTSASSSSRTLALFPDCFVSSVEVWISAALWYFSFSFYFWIYILIYALCLSLLGRHGSALGFSTTWTMGLHYIPGDIRWHNLKKGSTHSY